MIFRAKDNVTCSAVQCRLLSRKVCVLLGVCTEYFYWKQHSQFCFVIHILLIVDIIEPPRIGAVIFRVGSAAGEYIQHTKTVLTLELETNLREA